MNPKQFLPKSIPLRYILSSSLIVSLFFGLFIYSCQQETEQPEVILSADEAKQWFENQSGALVRLKSGTNTQSTLELKEDWEHAQTFKNDSLGTVEADILARGQFGFVLKEDQNQNETNGNYSSSYSKLVIQKNKRTGRMESFIMTLIGTKEYLKGHNFDLSKNTYLRKQKDFTGLVLYHTTSGDFVNGWNFQNGKVVGFCNQVDKKDLPSRLKQQAPIATTCFIVTINYYERICTDWYSNGRLTSISCGSWHLYDSYSFESCEYDVGGGDSGGSFVGSTSYQTRVNGQSYTHNPNDRFCRANMATTMSRQMANTCVTSIMEYTNHAFCGGNVNEGVFVLDYLKTYGQMVTDQGVSLNNITSFVNRHFDTSSFTSFVTAIDNGQIVMTDIRSDIPGSSHNVAVIGHHPDGTLIYMDPEQGTLCEAPASDFNQNYAISITGCKN
jgi:hypothetical protein